MSQTGWLTHDVWLGTNAYRADRPDPYRTKLSAWNVQSLRPDCLHHPGFCQPGQFYKSAYSGQAVLVTGDTITFNEHWQSLAAVSETWLTSRSFNPAGARTADYNAYRRQPDRQPDLQADPVRHDLFHLCGLLAAGRHRADHAGVTNSGQALPPYRTKEYEIGAKWALPQNIEMTTAAFRMSRPYAYLNSANNTFQVIGEQVNDGVETMWRGAAFSTALNLDRRRHLAQPGVARTGNPATSDKLVVSVPRWQGNLFANYDIPSLIGLSINANLHFASERAANVQNTTWADRLCDARSRPAYHRPAGHKLTFRAGASNVTNAHYWAAILPETVSGGSSQAGAATSVYAAFLGAPRVIHASMTAEF